MGFGLSISKQLTEAMRGSIYFESQLDIGSKFTFSIPLYRAQNITTDYPAFVETEILKNNTSTQKIFHTETSQSIPIEFIGSNLNLLPTINLAKSIQDINIQLNKSLDCHQLLEENAEKSREDNNSEIVNESPKVLIVDDTSINIFALQMLLRKLNVKSDSVT